MLNLKLELMLVLLNYLNLWKIINNNYTSHNILLNKPLSNKFSIILLKKLIIIKVKNDLSILLY
jgi:hypothetical protein